MLYSTFSSPLGPIIISTDGKKLTGFHFMEQRYFKDIPAGWKKDSKHPVLIEAIKQLKEYFGKKRKKFDLPLEAEGTPFQKEVWSALSKIPYGMPTTYQAIARMIDNPKAARAVGTAIGRNPLGIVVPCHRVVGTDGSLTGYAGGLDRKQKLLKLENCLTDSAQKLIKKPFITHS